MTEEFEAKEISKWIRIPAGIVLFLFTLLCIIGSMSLIISPPDKNPPLARSAGILMTLACLWVLVKSVRMVFGIKTKGGLMSPLTLRIIAVFFLCLPLAGFFTGYYKEKGIIAIVQALAYISIFFGLNGLAKYRANKNRETCENENKKDGKTPGSTADRD